MDPERGSFPPLWFGKSEQKEWKRRDIMGILVWIIVGIIAGWLAGLVMRGSGYGIVGDMVLGIVGALVGGFLAGALFNIPDPISGLNLTTLIVAFLGAVIVVALVRLIASGRPTV
jgi:uncharacterized membrane protein YeaQ/YmgE (transglycosylase-associated protein family)